MCPDQLLSWLLLSCWPSSAGPSQEVDSLHACSRDDMQARLKTGLSRPKGPPPDAVHMSSKLVDPEPVHNIQKLPAATDTQDEARHDLAILCPGLRHYTHIPCLNLPASTTCHCRHGVYSQSLNGVQHYSIVLPIPCSRLVCSCACPTPFQMFRFRHHTSWRVSLQAVSYADLGVGLVPSSLSCC